MKKSYETNDLKFGAQETRTEQFLTPDGVASLKTEKSSGAVIIENEIDPDSLNPVTGAAVAKAVASASGEVPVIGNSDNGKVLTAVVDGSDKHVEWGDGPVNDVVAGENKLVVKGTTNLNYKLTGHGPMGFGNLEYVGHFLNASGTELYLKYANPAHVSLSPRGDTSAQATINIAQAFSIDCANRYPQIVDVCYAPNDGSDTNAMPSMSLWTGANTINTVDYQLKTVTYSGSATALGENNFPDLFGEYAAIKFGGIENTEQVATIVEAASSGNITLNWPTGYTSQDADLVCASAPTGSDQNKVLTVTNSSGDLGWRDVPTPAYNPAIYDYGSDASAFMTAILANWSAGKPMMLRVPVSAFSSLTSGRQFWSGGYLFLPLVSFTSTGLTQTAIFALSDGLELFSAKFVIDEDEPAWEGVHSELDQ